MSDCTHEKHRPIREDFCKDCGKYFSDSTVRGNMMNDPHYRGYCGLDSKCSGLWYRTVFIKAKGQFECLACGWVSQFPKEFIALWLERWKDDKTPPQMRHFL